MKFWEAIILGLVQGLGEFLPISSSGHLILVRDIMSIQGDYLFFDIMLHLATLIAVFLAFYKDLLALFKPPFKTLGLIILASVPAVIMGVVYKLSNIDIFENAKYLCFMFLISAVLMFLAEVIGKRIKAPKEIDLQTGVLMGLMQAVAVFPGITRSGSTIFGGVVAGGERNKVAKFSFFMSIPIILGAALVESIGLFGGGENIAVVPWYCYLAGMITAFISGFLAIKLMLKVIAKANFKWFALYLFLLSIVTFIVYFLGIGG